MFGSPAVLRRAVFKGEISITTYHCLCVDLGATSGRGIVCSFDRAQG